MYRKVAFLIIKGGNMLQVISNSLTKIVSRILPDAFILALLLTLVIFFSGIVFTDSTPFDMLHYWGDGLWSLLTFTMQMCLVIVTGHALASTSQLQHFMKRVGRSVQKPATIAATIALFSAVMCSIHWGFGLIISAMLAREFARNVDGVDYRVLIAAAYMGFMTWHGGLMASIPLVAATEGHMLEPITGIIPVSETIFTPFNLLVIGGLFVILPVVAYLIHPKAEDVVFINPELLADQSKEQDDKLQPDTPAERLEKSSFLAYCIGCFGLGYIIYNWLSNGFTLDLNIGNMAFLSIGIILHGSPIAYVRAIKNGVMATSSVILQFPFYGGIQYMMEESGLGSSITDWFVSSATETTFTTYTFFASAVVNFFVPSGGGHWIVQGPLIMPAAVDLNINLGEAAMAIAYGDMWSNMAQPFWALPALAVAGLGIRDIMGFTLTALLVTLPLFLCTLFFL
ncbi:short-chain fatty acid transporter [Vibrio harveyi]|uniref:short-chain fatty acid transporter n=1 Tax=Vibrio harveyi TaxID=669 RepID=UPI0028C090A2|nr:TIGR00366 family protein [Vibrio harveyi]